MTYSNPPVPPDLAAPCQKLHELDAGDSRTVALWILDAVDAYQDCADKKAALVKAWPK